jgi:hypothetical protein
MNGSLNYDKADIHSNNHPANDKLHLTIERSIQFLDPSTTVFSLIIAAMTAN